MTDADKLTPADPIDLAESIAFALRFEGRKRKHDAAEYMAAIAAERVVRHLERVAFVAMKKLPLGGHSALGRGFEREGQNPISLTGFGRVGVWRGGVRLSISVCRPFRLAVP
jgi:hypothetical protein